MSEASVIKAKAIMTLATADEELIARMAGARSWKRWLKKQGRKQ